MTIAEIMKKMILVSDGNRHEISHFLKVYTYAKTIGELEGLDEETQYILEAAAIIHDIACPLCREKYGSCAGHLQEKESVPLVREFFEGTDVPEEVVERLAFLVSHHHTYEGVDGKDYRILLEADYLVNGDECKDDRETILKMREDCFRTPSATALLDSMFGL